MAKDITQQKIAILATDGVEQLELTEPRKALEDAGATTELVSLQAGEIKGWSHKEWGEMFRVDKVIDDVDASEYDGLLLPGGVQNPDKLRMNPKAVSFVKKFFDEGKVVAAICHAPWLLAEAGVLDGRKVTSWPSLQTDLRNAGAQWEDAEVVVDQGLVTSRKPDDIPAFNDKMLEELKEGPHHYIYNKKQGNQALNVQPSKTMENTDQQESLHVTPISHATMVLKLGGQIVYTDPVGGAVAFTGQPAPDIILITDIHGDHLNTDTLKAVSKEETVIVAPKVVADMLPENLPGTVVVVANGAKTTQKKIDIEAIPMYNLPESADAPHTKGRGNGYIVSANGERVYIAGDTGATPEMKALKNIDVAFVPMNLPYTMSIDDAAQGVLAFKPKVVHPYHYRGPDGLADINKFKQLVNAGDPNINVELLNFYPTTK